MEYELKHGNADNSLLQQAIKNGDVLPDFVKNKPYLIDDGLHFYLQAFFVLESERQIGFGVAPIPITKIIQYAEYLGYTKDTMQDFVEIIRQLDVFVVGFYAEKNKQK